MLNVWRGNLGKYNEGELVGDWLELPKRKVEIDKFLKEEVGLNDEYEEYMINDYETDLPIHIFEYEDINKLNILAEAIKGITNTEAIEAFVFRTEKSSLHIDKWIAKLQDYIMKLRLGLIWCWGVALLLTERENKPYER